MTAPAPERAPATTHRLPTVRADLDPEVRALIDQALREAEDERQAKAKLLKRLANSLLLLLTILSVIWIAGALAYHAVEDYRLIECFHFSMQTLTTTGYGDKSPQTDPGMIVAMMIQPTAVASTLLVGANFLKNAIDEPHLFSHEEQLTRAAVDDDTNCTAHEAVRKVEALDARFDRVEELLSQALKEPFGPRRIDKGL